MTFEKFAAEHGLDTTQRTEPITGTRIYVAEATRLAESAWRHGAQHAIELIPRRANEIRAGDVFGELTATGVEGRDANGKRTRLCVCSCGIEKVIIETRLRAGQVKSCGHWFEERFGMSATSEARNLKK